MPEKAILRHSFFRGENMSRYVFETQRMILTTSDLSMAKELLDFNYRNRKHFAEWEDKKPESFYTKDYMRYIIRSEIQDVRAGTGLVLYMREKESGNIIGKITVFGILGGNCSFCSLGYKLDEKYQHKGYMHEGLEETLAILFNEMGMHRVEVYILPKNEKSINVVKNLGFKEEGLAEKYMRIFGEWEDHLRFVMLREDRGEL